MVIPEIILLKETLIYQEILIGLLELRDNLPGLEVQFKEVQVQQEVLQVLDEQETKHITIPQQVFVIRLM